MRIGIGQKLTGSFLIVALLVGVLGYIGYSNSRDTAKQANVTADFEIPALIKLNEMKSLILEGIEKALSYPLLDDPKEKAEFYKNLDQFGIFAAEFEEIAHLGERGQEEETELFHQIISANEALAMAAAIFFEGYESDGIVNRSHINVFEQSIDTLIPLMDRFLKIETDEVLKSQESIRETAASAEKLTLLVVSGSFALALTLGFFISRSISIPINRLRDAAVRIGQGELDTDIDIKSKDEIGDLGISFSKMTRELRYTVAEREKAEDEIRNSLLEKEVLLQEINHRVKNNLQIISSLLSLQSQDIQDEQALRSFQVSQDRIKAMALVHEKLYQSDDLARIDIGEYIRSLADDLRSSYGLGSQDVNLTIDVDNILLGVDTAIPCGVIVNELVSNSLKHAFPEGRAGEIVISFRKIDGQYTMIFKDDGVGLPQDLDIRHPSSLGLTIVNALTGQLGGAIDRGHNGGTEINITFPSKQSKRE